MVLILRLTSLLVMIDVLMVLFIDFISRGQKRDALALSRYVKGVTFYL